MAAKTQKKRAEVAARDARLRKAFLAVKKRKEKCWPVKFARDNGLTKMNLNRNHPELYDLVADYGRLTAPEKMGSLTSPAAGDHAAKRRRQLEAKFREDYERMATELTEVRAALWQLEQDLAAAEEKVLTSADQVWKLERALDAILLRASDYDKELLRDLEEVLVKIGRQEGSETEPEGGESDDLRLV